MNKPNVLFLCTGNSCRSQMAEGFAKDILGDKLSAFSAGTDPHGMNAYAVRVMEEVGIDIISHHSKHIDELAELSFQTVVTVCDAARESCPLAPLGAKKVLHHSFEDPPKLAVGLTDEEKILECYRKVRDEIQAFIENEGKSLLLV